MQLQYPDEIRPGIFVELIRKIQKTSPGQREVFAALGESNPNAKG